jgi:sugar phosphate isomerase/epimerase
MTIHRGVSLYSFQQTQFFKELDLEGQIRTVASLGADGLEVIDEMSFPYPTPPESFVEQWFGWMEQYGTKPIALDVGLDVLQFRDHVMTYEEAADRLKRDIRLARRLGFSRVRAISVVPIEVIEMALPTAEEEDIILGREVHQPMSLEGHAVQEVLELRERTGSKHVRIVPDFGIFSFRPTEVLLGQFERRGSSRDASDASVELSLALRDGSAPFERDSSHTAGNLRVDFNQFIRTGDTRTELAPMFHGVKSFADARIRNASPLDYTVVAEALMLSDTSPELLGELAADGVVSHIHGKFNYMSETDVPGQYDEISIDYRGPIAALKAANWDGYIDSEYEGQRYFQDLERPGLQTEVEQVRRHQEMLRRLIDA